VLNVLIVDDDFMLADNLEDILLGGGYAVCGVAGTVTDAINLGTKFHPDLGVIDLRLADGGFGTEVASALRRLAPFGVLYSTGNPEHPLLRDAEGEGCIAKPYMSGAFLEALSAVRLKMCHAPQTAKLPKGFKFLN
jgi:CheY-like chemotaxis protein